MGRPKDSKNKVPAMKHINMYVSEEVVKYFKAQKNPRGFTSGMREVLERFVSRNQ